MNEPTNNHLLALLVLAGSVGLLVGFAFYWFFRFRREKIDRDRLAVRVNELEQRLDSRELENIRYKLNPHLFKNALNSIQSNAYQTYFSLEKLSNVLDFILYESDRQFVTVREEIEFAASLIEINRVKLSPLFDLRVKVKADEQHPFYEQELLAPLITVDLIENAFKHAELQTERAFISIVFELEDGYFSLEVRNVVASKPAAGKGGIGKENLVKRLNLVYKNNFTLEQKTDDGIFISRLKINLLEHKAQMLIAG